MISCENFTGEPKAGNVEKRIEIPGKGEKTLLGKTKIRRAPLPGLKINQTILGGNVL